MFPNKITGGKERNVLPVHGIIFFDFTVEISGEPVSNRQSIQTEKMSLSQKDKVPKQKKCHCEPVRRLVWQSPRFSNSYVRKSGGFTSIREIVTGGNPLAGPRQ